METKKMSLEKMENIEGGSNAEYCVLAALGFALANPVTIGAATLFAAVCFSGDTRH